MVADGAYSGEKNVLKAKEHNIRLVTTNFAGYKPADILAEFIFSEDGHELMECANHKHSYYIRYDEKNDRCVARFEIGDCQQCPNKEACNPRFRNNSTLKEVSWKAVNRAKMLRYMKTEEFHELAHFRSGVEAIPSLLRRRYHVDKIPAHTRYDSSHLTKTKSC